MLPLVAVIEEFKSDKNLKIAYVGEGTPLEKTIFQGRKVKLYKIQAGKLRRYFSFKNLVDVFRMPLGLVQSLKIIKEFKPNVIFSKGGYVSVPVIIAGWIMRIPIVIHESDTIPGLATQMGSVFAKKICLGFKKTFEEFPQNKIVVTGIPLRKELMKGNKKTGYSLTGFDESLPVTLVMGGSQGASSINETVFHSLKMLLKHTQIIHICGTGKTKKMKLPIKLQKRYKAFEFVTKELAHLYKIADLIISRAGANSLAEIRAILKPSILIPLSRKVSRGDQIENAKVFKKTGASIVIQEKNLDSKILEEKIISLLRGKKAQEKMIKNLKKIPDSLGAAKKIKQLLLSRKI